MVVIPHAEPLLDEVADHRPGPDARLVSRRDRTKFDQDSQRRALIVAELRRRSFCHRVPQPFDVIRVVPLQPTVHGTTGHVELRGDVDDMRAVDVRANGSPSSPLVEVVFELRLEDEGIELFDLRGATTRSPNRLTCFSASHDQVTMILVRSAVKRGSQPARPCLETSIVRYALGVRHTLALSKTQRMLARAKTEQSREADSKRTVVKGLNRLVYLVG